MTEVYVDPDTNSAHIEAVEHEPTANVSDRTIAEVAVLMRRRTADIVEADAARRMVAVREAMRDRQLGSRAVRSE